MTPDEREGAFYLLIIAIFFGLTFWQDGFLGGLLYIVVLVTVISGINWLAKKVRGR